MAPRVLVDATGVPADRGALGRYVDGLVCALARAGADLAVACQRGISLFGFPRRHARLITGIGGGVLGAVGVLEVTGAWATAITWMQVHWVGSYQSPL